VFIVEGQYVVKFFSKFHKGGAAWRTESNLYKLFTSNNMSFTPKLYGSGSLAEVYGVPELMEQFDLATINPIPSNCWPWPFLIVERIPGSSLKEVRGNLANEQEKEDDLVEQVAKQLGPVLRQFHKVTVPQSISEQLHNLRSDHFKQFLNRQLKNYEFNHKKWNRLPPHLFSQLSDYLPTSSDELLREKDGLVFMHCDLHEDHIFLSLVDNDTRNDKVEAKVTGVIDFNDCTVGLRLYELIQIHMNSFQCNKRMLKTLLESLEWVDELQDTKKFAYRCLCLTLLHEYNMFNTVEEGYIIELEQVESLSSLATLMWDVSDLDLKLPIRHCDVQFTSPCASTTTTKIE